MKISEFVRYFSRVENQQIDRNKRDEQDTVCRNI